MILSDFIENFIEHNSLIRLVYKEKGGHKIVLDKWDDVSMEHEILKGKGKFGEFINNNVIGVTDISVDEYPEAINIVIEEMDITELRKIKIDKITG